MIHLIVRNIRVTRIQRRLSRMNSQKRDNKGRFTSENPKNIIMRVTTEEKLLIEKFRQIQPSKTSESSQSLKDLQTLIRKRVDNIEF